ncbi:MULTISPECIES: YjcQ family protein [Bacillus cereus group]|uniref:YjcQ family protein n=1 Tax=Bacillus cereus group TaxID=86661 RepID=UPI000BF7FFC9|nr:MULTISPECIES: YjcQ family protein [Bacillus cereus group]PEV47423.1 hypothetical protein CN426_07860 [Bacillus thuringiensis]PGS52901.1 hypothetical protein COC66_21995 [Bacillus cereus]
MNTKDLILKSLYDEGNKENPDLGKLNASFFNLTQQDFIDSVLHLEEERYITGIYKSEGGQGNKVLIVWFGLNTMLTEKAIERLAQIF